MGPLVCAQVTNRIDRGKGWAPAPSGRLFLEILFFSLFFFNATSDLDLVVSFFLFKLIMVGQKNCLLPS